MTDEIRRWGLAKDTWAEQYKDKIFICRQGIDTEISHYADVVVNQALQMLSSNANISPDEKGVLLRMIGAINEARNNVADYAATQLARDAEMRDD